MTPLSLLIAVLPVILLVGGLRRFVAQALYVVFQCLCWTLQQVFGAAPGWLTRITLNFQAAAQGTVNWIVRVLQFIACTMGAIVVLNVIAFKMGSGWFFWAEALVMGTICFTLFMVSRLRDGKWFAAATLVFYGLAVAGVVFPSVVKVYPTLFVIGMFLVPMIKVFKEACPRLGLALGGLAMAALLSVIAFNYIGWVKLGTDRVRFDNAVVVGQANAEAAFNEKAQTAIGDTVEGIYDTMATEIATGAPDPTKADGDLKKLAAQKAIVAKVRQVNPVTNNQPTSGRWLPRLRQKTLVGLLLLLVVVALAWPKKSGLAALTTH